MNPRPHTPLLDKVRIPADLRRLPESDLPQLAAELRAEMIDAVSQTGGHLGAGSKRQDTLYLYRRPILDQWAESGEDLTRLVNRVILHEIGHHFGFTPEDIEMYEEDMFGATALGTSAG